MDESEVVSMLRDDGYQIYDTGILNNYCGYAMEIVSFTPWKKIKSIKIFHKTITIHLWGANYDSPEPIHLSKNGDHAKDIYRYLINRFMEFSVSRNK